MNKQSQFILSNAGLFRDPDKDKARLAAAREEALVIVRKALERLEAPENDTLCEINRLHGLIGLLHKNANKVG